jgi:proteasome lid subunit RPN8/RPN11
MHFFDEAQYRKLLREARDFARQKAGAEICGLIVHTGYHLAFVRTRNISRRAGGFVLSPQDVRRIVAATKILGQEVVGTFHSHPAALAIPGSSDIEHAVDDSLMFIFDCVGRQGRLWKIRRRRARSMKFGFLDHDT